MPFEEIEFKNRIEKEAYQIRQIKIALNRLGYYRPEEGKGILGEADDGFYEALEMFQQNNFQLRGNKDIFNTRLEEKLTTALEEKDQNSFAFTARYIWRTAGDNKVRHDHAIREGRIYEWDNPPEGGHPGENYNCRCWADPLVPLQPKGLSVGFEDLHDVRALARLDAINPAVAPWELLGTVIGLSRFGLIKIFQKAPKLNKEQMDNFRRYIGKIPANSKNNVKITKTAKSDIKFSTFSKGKVKGSKSVYEKTVNKDGKTIKYIKTTYDPEGKVIHVKNKLK